MSGWKPLSRWSERRKEKEDDLERELGADLELEAEVQQEAGASAEEARYRALRSMGNTARVKQDVRMTWRWTWLEQLGQDLRYGVRGLRRNKGFTAVSALSLALGIGGNAAVFSLVNAVLLRRLPYPEPERLVQVTGFYPKGAIAELQEQSRTMDIAGYSTDSEVNLTGQGEALRLIGSTVSANLFSVLGADAGLGRTTRVGDEQPGRDRVVILGDALWYAQTLGATHLVDVATLTGACTIALGKSVSGLFGSSSSWVDTVQAAAATMPVIDNTIAIQIGTMRRARWRSRANSIISIPANCPDISWYSSSSSATGLAGQSCGSRVS